MNQSGLPTFQGTQQSQLFELDRVEIAFAQILKNQGLPAQHSRESDTDTTPRIELQMDTEPVLNHWHLFTGAQTSQFLMRDAWTFKMTSTIVTNREQNGSSHVPLVGLARWNMQMAQMLTYWTLELCPTHEIIDLREESGSPDVWNEGGCDMSKLTFSGMFSIRKSAW